jgi:hypothetical protein
MTLKLRISVIMLFATGFLVCAASVVRTFYTFKLNVSTDKTWDGFNVYLTGSLELYVGIVSRLVPILVQKDLFKGE